MLITVCLERVRLQAHHGVFEHELRDGNEFEVNMRVSYEADSLLQFESDDIASTVSYADLFEIVKREMAVPRKLLETVAARIVTETKSRFPYLAEIRCSITKLSPPIPSFSGSATVECSLP